MSRETKTGVGDVYAEDTCLRRVHDDDDGGGGGGGGDLCVYGYGGEEYKDGGRGWELNIYHDLVYSRTIITTLNEHLFGLGIDQVIFCEPYFENHLETPNQASRHAY